jgi:hypothetical protein
MIDEEHVIMNKELDKAQRSWLFKVMQDLFKQPTCKAIVTKHEETKDTRAIWKDIVQEMEKSMAAYIHTDVLSTYLTNTKLATQGWKGTQTNWFIHFKEQACATTKLLLIPTHQVCLCNSWRTLCWEFLTLRTSFDLYNLQELQPG